MLRSLILKKTSDINNKKIFILLSKIYGIGKTKALELCSLVGLTENTRVSEITEMEIDFLEKTIESKFVVNQELRKFNNNNIINLIETNSYKGRRHLKGYPVRGQRTRSNAKSQKTFHKLSY